MSQALKTYSKGAPFYNAWYIISGISLILLEAFLIGGLVWQRAERLKSEIAVRASEERLRLAQQTREELLKIFVKHVPAAPGSEHSETKPRK